MSAITVDGDLVHYERLGRGRPIILLHGWIGSWRYWVPLMKVLSLKYSVYAIDLFGFGDSGKNSVHYTLDQQVRLIDEFTQKLGIPKAAFVGHGLGAMVILEFAKSSPDKVARILVSSLPLFDPGDLDERNPVGVRRSLSAPTPLNPLLPLTDNAKPTSEADSANKSESFHELPTVPRLTMNDRDRLRAAFGSDILESPLPKPASASADVTSPTPSSSEVTIPKSPLAASIPTSSPAVTSAPISDKNGTNPLSKLFNGIDLNAMLAKAFKRSDEIYDKLKIDVERTDVDVLMHSARGFDAGRILDDLRQMKMPVVVVHGEDDPILEPPNEKIWNYLTMDKEDSLVPILLPGVRHFPMLEHEPFTRLVNDFLEIADVSKLELKERWRRRSR